MNEKIYVIIMAIVSSGIFGYVVNTIGTIFSDLTMKEAEYK